jgi:hypothetical protein
MSNIKARIQRLLAAQNRIAFYDHIVQGSTVCIRVGGKRGQIGHVVSIEERKNGSEDYIHVVAVALENGTVETYHSEHLTALNPFYSHDYVNKILANTDYNPFFHTEALLMEMQARLPVGQPLAMAAE